MQLRGGGNPMQQGTTVIYTLCVIYIYTSLQQICNYKTLYIAGLYSTTLMMIIQV